MTNVDIWDEPLMRGSNLIYTDQTNGNVYSIPLGADPPVVYVSGRTISLGPSLNAQDEVVFCSSDSTVPDSRLHLLGPALSEIWSVPLPGDLFGTILTDQQDRMYLTVANYSPEETEAWALCIDHDQSLLWDYAPEGVVPQVLAITDEGQLLVAELPTNDPTDTRETMLTLIGNF
jgi:hypothetical protein